MGKELLAGCGMRRDKIIRTPNCPNWTELTTLDINRDARPDVLWDLRTRPLPFDDNTFTELHFYEVLEHLSVPDEFVFFEEFREYWRILKPDGLLCATVPRWDSIWAWGDPSHKRIINEGSLAFLSHAQYEAQLGKTPMSDYRSLLGETNFEPVWMQQEESFVFVLRAIKGSNRVD